MKKRYWVSLLFLLIFLFSCATVGIDTQVNDFYNLALDLHKSGNFERAKYYYLRALNSEDPPFDAMYNLVLLYIQSNNYTAARDMLSDLQKNDPENREFKHLELYLEASQEGGDPLVVANEILEIYPRDLYALQVSAELYLKKGNPQKAREMLEIIPADQQDELYLDLMIRVIQWVDTSINEDGNQVNKVEGLSENSSIIFPIPDDIIVHIPADLSALYPDDENEASQDVPPELINIEEMELLWNFREQDWFSLARIERLWILLNTAEERDKQLQLLELWEKDFPEEKAKILFHKASLELEHLDLWEQGLRDMRLSLSQGFSMWNDYRALIQRLDPELQSELEYLEELYNWQ
ncbi:MAG: tetratricopeptide repeat protein [Spirochaetaceae bacterium]|nr:tetratricopeptide repeat protein [Spirochaetaceae bacterium]